MSAVDDNDRIYLFDELTLDLARGWVTRSGETIHLRPQTYKVLAYLVEKRGHLISKDQLIEEVWKGRAVTDGSLGKCIEELREALGPEAKEFIRNVRGRGYIYDTGDEPDTGPETLARSDQIEVVKVTVEEHEEFPDAVAPKAIFTAISAPRWTGWKIAAGVVFLSAVAALGAFVWFRSAIESQSPTRSGELTLLRITNGVKPIDAAISPNGDYFAYTELTDDGPIFWLHQVGGANRVEIAGPSGRYYGGKTFAPDGRFIYFVGLEETTDTWSLYRVAAIGGRQVKILDGVNRPVSFSPDGSEMAFIRYDKRTGVSALTIAGSDGKNERILLERAGSVQIVGGPAWSPDGRLIVFAESDAGIRPGPIGLFSIKMSDSSMSAVSQERWDNIYRIAWTSEGRGLAFVGTRAGEGYSTRRDQVYYVSYPEGESRRLTFDGSRHQEWSIGVTKDAAILAIPFNRSSQIWSMDPNGDATSAVQVSHGMGDGRAGLAPLPDGRVGFIARLGDEVNAWIMNSDGSALKQLTSGFDVVEELRADPQGRFFVFSALKKGHSHIYLSDVEGQNTRQVTSGDGHEIDSSVSHDGKWLVYNSVPSSPLKPELFKISIDGGEPLKFSNTECATPNFSPVGDLLSCIPNEKEIVVLAAADGSQTNTYELPQFSKINFGARWTPDGRGLIYIRNEKGFSNLWVQPLDDGSPRQLTTFTSGEIYNYAFSIDGTRLFVARGYPINDAVLIRNFR